MATDNPFERYGLDPRDGVAAITERLKELVEDARDDAERERIRAAWDELTMHPARRLRAALHAHPETRPPLGAPPRSPRRAVAVVSLELRDLAARPSAVAALPWSADCAAAGVPGCDAPPLSDDPWLR